MTKSLMLLLVLVVIGLSVAAVYIGRNTMSDREMQMKFVGTWRCPPEPDGMLKGEWGPTRLTMTLGAKGDFEMTTEVIGSPGGDGVIKQTGRYAIDGDRFVSSEVDRGEACKISLEDTVLVLTLSDGESFRFARIK